MLHPSQSAIDYIWEAFSACYFERSTINLWKEVARISKAFNHRISTESEIKKNDFARRILEQISDIKVKIPQIDLSLEEEYFLKMRIQ
jgi:hypothetical protein